MSKRSRSKSTRARRKLRPRGTPKWIAMRQNLAEMARRRCLMVLSVLSGERPVTEAIADAKISRGTYYQLEERALLAMIAALTPASVEHGESAVESAAKKLAELEAKVAKLEREKRRSDRLLFLMRKVIKPGSLTTTVERPSKRAKRRSSTTAGPKPSRGSSKTTSTESASPSMSTPDGEVAR